MVGVRKFCRRTMTLEGFRRDWLAGGVLARRASTRERGYLLVFAEGLRRRNWGPKASALPPDARLGFARLGGVKLGTISREEGKKRCSSRFDLGREISDERKLVAWLLRPVCARRNSIDD